MLVGFKTTTHGQPPLTKFKTHQHRKQKVESIPNKK